MGLLMRHLLRLLMDTLYRIADRIDLFLDGDYPSIGEFDPEDGCGSCDCFDCSIGDCCFGCECEMCEEEREQDIKDFERDLNRPDDDDDDDDWNILRFVQ